VLRPHYEMTANLHRRISSLFLVRYNSCCTALLLHWLSLNGLGDDLWLFHSEILNQNLAGHWGSDLTTVPPVFNKRNEDNFGFLRGGEACKPGMVFTLSTALA
jgi:hypothetical protein